MQRAMQLRLPAIGTLALIASLAFAAPAAAEMIAPRPAPAGEPVMQQPVASTPAPGYLGRAVMARPRPTPPGGGGMGTGPGRIGLIGVGRPMPVVPPAPRIRILATLTRVEGGIPRAHAQRSMPQLELIAARCYTDALRMNPSAQGLIVVRMSVIPAGGVAEVEETADYVHDANLSVCLMNQYHAARFRPFAAATPGFVMLQIRFLQH